MRNRFFLVLIATTLCSTPRLFALSEKGQEAVRQLDAALIEESKADKPKPDESGYARQNNKAGLLPRLREILAKPEAPQFMESLTQLTTYFTSEAVQKNFSILQSELRIEREENEKKRVIEINSALDRARKTVLQARAPADLDDTIVELAKYRQREDRSQPSEEVGAAYYQVEPVLQFAVNWQNYLSAQAKGNLQAANNALQNITGNNSSPYLIPRSQILALIKPERGGEEPVEVNPQIDIDKVLAEIKSLVDVENGLILLRDLQQKRRRNGGSDPISVVSQNLQQIDKTYQEYKAGLSVNIDLNQGYNNSGTDIGNALFARLKSELMFLVLPRYVGAPENSVPKKDEDVIRFLDRLTAEARTRGDINVGIRAREAIRLLQRGNSFSNNDSVGIAAFISGQNQETAGQYVLAVLSYQTALKSGSDLVPSKIIGERLAAIQSAHPKEFDSAMDRFLNPPTPRYNDMPQRFSNGMPDPRPNAAPGRPALLIPPVSVGPATSPSPSAAPNVTPVPSATATPNL